MSRVGLIVHLFRRGAEIQRKRMAMTVAAIAWGTLSIVLLLSFGEGMKRAFTRGSRGLGEGIVVVWPGATSLAYAGFPQGRNLRFLPEDVQMLQDSIPEITRASGEMRRWGNSVTYGRTALTKPVVGAEPTYGELRNQAPQPGGRFLNERDEAAKRRVAFLGNDLADELFGDEAPVGKTILVNQVPFLVIGVMQDKLQMGTYGGPDANNVVIPLSTFRALFSRRYLSNIVVKAESEAANATMISRLHEVLGAKYRFDPKDERALAKWDTYRSQNNTRNVSIGIQIFLGVIGALTLLIGGVGVRQHHVRGGETPHQRDRGADGARRTPVVHIGTAGARIAVAHRVGWRHRRGWRLPAGPRSGICPDQVQQRSAGVYGHPDLFAGDRRRHSWPARLDRFSGRLLSIPSRRGHPARRRPALRVSTVMTEGASSRTPSPGNTARLRGLHS